MTRTLFAAALALALAGPGAAADPKADAPTVDLAGSVADETLAAAAPPAVVSAKGFEALAKAWGLKETPTVDWEKELIVVATTRGGRLTLTTKLDAAGDLKALGLATRDFRPGFRYALRSVKRDGVKTLNGKPLPAE